MSVSQSTTSVLLYVDPCELPRVRERAPLADTVRPPVLDLPGAVSVTVDEFCARPAEAAAWWEALAQLALQQAAWCKDRVGDSAAGTEERR